MATGTNYVAIRPACGHCVGAVVIDLARPSLHARALKEWSERGLRIEVASTSWVREHLAECNCQSKGGPSSRQLGFGQLLTLEEEG